MVERPLSQREARARDFIVDYWSRHGRGPSVREVGADLGMTSPNNAQHVIGRLIEKGAIKAGEVGGQHGRPRKGLQVVPTSDPLLIPFRGRVSCGPPAPRDADDEPPLDLRAMFRRDDLVAFRAAGDSMIEAGIFPRDYLICVPDESPAPGQTVVATVKGEMLCKRLKKRKGELVLEPCNGGMEPIEVDYDTRFLGVLHAVLRKV